MKWLHVFILIFLTAISAHSRSADQFQFDGIRIGDNYEEKIINRSPYMEPCDNDPVGNKSRRAMFYAPDICRGAPAFPENTLVTFYLKYDDSDKRYAQPVEVIMWQGGNYFSGKTDFPYKIGITPETITEFGKPEKISKIHKNLVFKIFRFQGDINAVAYEGKVIAYVIGSMPSDYDNEQWRMIFKIYRKYYIKNR